MKKRKLSLKKLFLAVALVCSKDSLAGFALPVEFAPYQYQVGVEAVKAAATAPQVSQVVSTAAAANEAVYARAVGGTILNPLTSFMEQRAAQLAAAAANDATFSLAAAAANDAEYLAATNAARLAQTGSALEGLFTVSRLAMGGAFLAAILPQGLGDDDTFNDTFDPVSGKPVTFSGFDSVNHTSGKIPVAVNMQPLDSQSVAVRQAEIEAIEKTGCPDSSLIPSAAVCMPYKAVYNVSTQAWGDMAKQSHDNYMEMNFGDIGLPLPGCNADGCPIIFKNFNNELGRNLQNDWINFHMDQYNKSISFVTGDVYSALSFVSFSLDLSLLKPGIQSYLSSRFSFSMNDESQIYFDDSSGVIVAIESSVSKCPTGTKFYGNLASNFTQLCVPDYANDPLKTPYQTYSTKTGSYPTYEVWADGTIHKHPKVIEREKQLAQTGVGSAYSIDSTLSGDGRVLTFTKPANQYVSGKFSYTPLPGTGFAISDETDGFSLTRPDGSQTKFKIKEVSVYDYNFQLLDRQLSYLTEDGYALDPQTGSLASGTFGQAGVMLATQFNIQQMPYLSPDPVTNPNPNPSTNPDPNTNPNPNPSTNPDPTTNPNPNPSTNPDPNTGTNPSPTTNPAPNTQPIPCGLGNGVTMIFTKIVSGVPQTYSQKVNSPPCVVDFGKAPVPPAAPTLPDWTPVLSKLPNFLKPVNFPISSTCPPFEFDLSDVKLFSEQFRFEKYIITMHCDLINPHISFLRLLSMIGWFLLALWRVLDA